MTGPGLSITDGLREVASRLTEAAAIAKAAVTCAENGSEREAVQLSLSLDEFLHDAEALHQTVRIMSRMERDHSG